MSQITYVVQYKGEARKNYGHYAELAFDTRKRIRRDFQYRIESEKDPQKKKEVYELMEAQIKDPSLFNSGIVNERAEKNLLTVTDSNKAEWFNELAPKDLPKIGKDAFMSDTGEKPIVYVDLDDNILYVDEHWDGSANNGFDDFQSYLPEGWAYKEMTSAAMMERYKHTKLPQHAQLALAQKYEKMGYPVAAIYGSGDIPMGKVPSSNPKGWHKEPVNHALASKGIKVGKARVKR